MMGFGYLRIRGLSMEHFTLIRRERQMKPFTGSFNRCVPGKLIRLPAAVFAYCAE